MSKLFYGVFLMHTEVHLGWRDRLRVLWNGKASVWVGSRSWPTNKKSSEVLVDEALDEVTSTVLTRSIFRLPRRQRGGFVVSKVRGPT